MSYPSFSVSGNKFDQVGFSILFINNNCMYSNTICMHVFCQMNCFYLLQYVLYSHVTWLIMCAVLAITCLMKYNIQMEIFEHIICQPQKVIVFFLLVYILWTAEKMFRCCRSKYAFCFKGKVKLLLKAKKFMKMGTAFHISFSILFFQPS